MNVSNRHGTTSQCEMPRSRASAGMSHSGMEPRGSIALAIHAILARFRRCVFDDSVHVIDNSSGGVAL